LFSRRKKLRFGTTLGCVNDDRILIFGEVVDFFSAQNNKINLFCGSNCWDHIKNALCFDWVNTATQHAAMIGKRAVWLLD